MTCTGEREISAVSERLPDNPGELAYMPTSSAFVCRLSALRWNNSFYADASPVVGGREDTQQSFIRGVPPRGPTPYHLHTISDRKGTSFVYSRTSTKGHLSTTAFFIGGQSIHRRFFKPLYNNHFFYLKVAVVERVNCIFH